MKRKNSRKGEGGKWKVENGEAAGVFRVYKNYGSAVLTRPISYYY